MKPRIRYFATIEVMELMRYRCWSVSWLVLLIIGIFCWRIIDGLDRIKRDDHEKNSAVMADVCAEAEGSVLRIDICSQNTAGHEWRL